MAAFLMDAEAADDKNRKAMAKYEAAREKENQLQALANAAAAAAGFKEMALNAEAVCLISCWGASPRK